MRQPDSQAVLAQFAGARIKLEHPKTELHAEVNVLFHGKVSA
jgi:hypothetical protein